MMLFCCWSKWYRTKLFNDSILEKSTNLKAEMQQNAGAHRSNVHVKGMCGKKANNNRNKSSVTTWMFQLFWQCPVWLPSCIASGLLHAYIAPSLSVYCPPACEVQGKNQHSLCRTTAMYTPPSRQLCWYFKVVEWWSFDIKCAIHCKGHIRVKCNSSTVFHLDTKFINCVSHWYANSFKS